MSSKYETVVGLEVHTELKTKSKIFCGCTTEFGGNQNTHVCPVCLGLPGAMPVLNKQVVEFAIKVGLALNCEILNFNKFDRKNYYYPDLPKNYQTSQYDLPICLNGHLDIEVNGETKRIGITRIHMEEDAGKLVHSGNTISDSKSSNVDYNRTGVPLLEIVSEPDIRSGAEARAYVEKLRSILQYLEVSDGRMEEGSLRGDCNVSVRLRGTKEFGTRTETKNVNSLTAIQKVVEDEALRQAKLIEAGGKVDQETRTWDDAQGITIGMRKKDEENDYRYFPDPDLPPIILTDTVIKMLGDAVPELPDARKKKYVGEYGLSAHDAEQLIANKYIADYFEAAAKLTAYPKLLANLMTGELFSLLEQDGDDVVIPIDGAHLASVATMSGDGTINSSTAKKLVKTLFEHDADPEVIVRENDLAQISDPEILGKYVDEAIASDPKTVAAVKAGRTNAAKALMGKIMAKTGGKGNPVKINELLEAALAKITG